MRFKIIKTAAILYRFQKYSCTWRGDSGCLQQSGNKYADRVLRVNSYEHDIDLNIRLIPVTAIHMQRTT